ncbi:hypothetical protein CR513_29225, partial [Mucuna pruriens]
MHVWDTSDNTSSILETDNFDIRPDFSDNPLYEPKSMENNGRSLKEPATPDSGLIHLLPKFHSLAGVPRGLLYDETVGDIGGLYQDEGVSVLPRRSNERLAVFAVSYVQHMGRYEANPSGRRFAESINIQEKLCMSTERGLISCAPHVRTTRSANNCNCRLLLMDRNMIDVASGGALMDKTPVVARHLISNIASNT